MLMSEDCKHRDYEVYDKMEDIILAECKDCGETLTFVLKSVGDLFSCLKLTKIGE